MIHNHCIATGYPGNMDVMTPPNNYPVGYRLVELERNWGPCEAGNHWAEPDVAHVAALMQQVYTERDEAAERGQTAVHDIRCWHGAQTVGEAMRRRLQLLALRAAQFDGPKIPRGATDWLRQR